MTRKRTIWHLEVPLHLNKQLEEYIRNNSFATKSECIRTVVREHLKKELEQKRSLEVKHNNPLEFLAQLIDGEKKNASK
jgi:Arc/MetJ-type ribon-helix-helix transcriptional regulator